MQYSLNYSGCCPLKIKITQFSDGLFRLNIENCLCLNVYKQLTGDFTLAH